LRALLPLLLLLPLLVWLAVRIVRRELAPVRTLAQTLDAQPADNPAALSETGCPDEITPFVRSINRLLERVRLLMADQRRFIADAAHELRTPLTALSLQAQNLRKAATLEDMLDRAAPLKEGIERSRRLTEQLLSHARSQVGPPSSQLVNVAKLLRDLIAEYIPLAREKNIDVGMDGAEDLSLYADPQMLLLVLRNALENALRYTPANGEITLRYRVENDDAVIEVIDSGPGIPGSERERVFGPFYRIAGIPGTGSGLGLAIARDAATRIGGRVSLHESKNAPGLIFEYRQQLH
jgi:two-component system, OmpR family, sensor kinase